MKKINKNFEDLGDIQQLTNKLGCREFNIF
jgi:hypothetical protein